MYVCSYRYTRTIVKDSSQIFVYFLVDTSEKTGTSDI